MERPSFEDALEAACLRHQLGVIPYYSLAGGFLTGKYRSKADLGKSAARGGSVAKYLDGKGPMMTRPGITAPIDLFGRQLQRRGLDKIDDLLGLRGAGAVLER